MSEQKLSLLALSTVWYVVVMRLGVMTNLNLPLPVEELFELGKE